MAESKRAVAQCEDDLLALAAQEAAVDLDLLRRLIALRQRDFPSLDRWGAKKEFENAIVRLVTQAAMQEEKEKATSP